MGIFLSTNSYAENAPEPIPIDFGVNGGMRGCEINDVCSSDEDCYSCPEDCGVCCEDCNTNYNPYLMGASCCDEAIALDPLLTCEILETGYYWNCSGCGCSDWDNGTNDLGYQWTTDFGCMDSTVGVNPDIIGNCSDENPPVADEDCESGQGYSPCNYMDLLFGMMAVVYM